MNDEWKDPQQSDSADPVRLPEVRWPARTQRLLGELRVLCGKWLQEPLRRSVDRFEMCLNRQAGQTRSHLDQQHYLTTRRQLLNGRQAFDERFIASIDQAFDRIGMPMIESAEAIPQGLSLLDPMEHELAAALDQLVARSTARGGVQLIELGYRLAVLVGTPPLESEALPVGPQAMARAFREASGTLGLPNTHELLLLQSLESSLIKELGPLHELMNAHLLADGILPRLRPFRLPRDAARRDHAKKKSAQFAAPVGATENHEPLEMPGRGLETLAQSWSDHEKNSSLKGVSMTDAELQVALGALQERLFHVDARTRFELSRPQRLREDLLIQLNVGRPPQSARASLSTDQGYVVELIVRLFGQIAQQLPQSTDVQSLICDLQLPMLRMALIDHGFFEQHAHPARKLLGKMVETAREWLDDASGTTDGGFRAQLSRLTERAGREPPSAALYVSLLNDMEQYLTQLRNKTQLAERRQVDAMQGFERLEQARHRVAELLTKRFKSPSQRLLLARLDHAWSDVLALTLLRHGERSQIFGTQLVIADQLLGCLPIGNRHKLQHEVEAGLRQIGIQDDAITQLAQRMIDANQNEFAANAINRRDRGTHPTQRENSPHNVVESINTDVVISTIGTVEVTSSPEVLRIHRHLRSLPTGTWFEFIDPSGGRGSRRRLVWYSALTGHSLFVTRNGQRAEELGELRLAYEIVCVRVREVASDNEDVLDHAWRAVTRELSQQPHPITLGRL